MYEMGQEEVDAVVSVLKSREYFRYKGAERQSITDRFEIELQEYFKISHALLISSGTNALTLALEAYGIGEGDEVLIPIHTFVATALAVNAVGATPVVVNVDDQLLIDIKDIEKKITDKTRAIIPVHIDGLICSMSAIKKIADAHKLILVEDCAQAIGGKYKDNHVGTIGHAGCFSLNMDKIITAGEGGVVITNDREKYEHMLCNHDSANQYGPTKKNEYTNIKPFSGRSMRVSEITAALAQVQLKRLDSILDRLRSIKAECCKEIEQLPLRIIRGHDAEGDCAISIHLVFDNPKQMTEAAKNLLANGYISAPITTRLAHFGWQWKNILPKFNMFEFLTTLDLCSRVLRIQVGYDWQRENYIEINKIIKGCLSEG